MPEISVKINSIEKRLRVRLLHANNLKTKQVTDLFEIILGKPGFHFISAGISLTYHWITFLPEISNRKGTPAYLSSVVI